MAVKENGSVLCEALYSGPCDIGLPCSKNCREAQKLKRKRREWCKKRIKEELEEMENINETGN